MKEWERQRREGRDEKEGRKTNREEEKQERSGEEDISSWIINEPLTLLGRPHMKRLFADRY